MNTQLKNRIASSNKIAQSLINRYLPRYDYLSKKEKLTPEELRELKSLREVLSGFKKSGVMQ